MFVDESILGETEGLIDLENPEPTRTKIVEIIDLERATPARVRSWSFGSIRTDKEKGKSVKKRKRLETSTDIEYGTEDEVENNEEDEREKAETVEKGVQAIPKLIEELKGNVEQNTKKKR